MHISFTDLIFFFVFFSILCYYFVWWIEIETYVSYIVSLNTFIFRQFYIQAVSVNFRRQSRGNRGSPKISLVCLLISSSFVRWHHFDNVSSTFCLSLEHCNFQHKSILKYLHLNWSYSQKVHETPGYMMYGILIYVYIREAQI